jgi:hypothetical protein
MHPEAFHDAVFHVEPLRRWKYRRIGSGGNSLIDMVFPELMEFLVEGGHTTVDLRLRPGR